MSEVCTAAETSPTSVQCEPGVRGGLVLEELVVTARRREESLQDVPTSIIALDSESLFKRGIQTEQDLQFAAPGLMIRTFARSNSFNFVTRGQSMDAFSGSQPGVQPYVNDVPLFQNAPSVFYNIENVQVLKGPQGTLFGRNSTGGAVLLNTARAEREFGGYAQARHEVETDLLDVQGAVNMPFAGESASLRIAGVYKTGGGFIDNEYDAEKGIGDRKIRSGRATLMLNPMDGLTNVTVAEVTRQSGQQGPNIAHNILPLPGAAQEYSAAAAAAGLYQSPDRRHL